MIDIKHESKIFSDKLKIIGKKLMQEHQHKRTISFGNLDQSDILWQPPSKDSILKSYHDLFIFQFKTMPQEQTMMVELRDNI